MKTRFFLAQNFKNEVLKMLQVVEGLRFRNQDILELKKNVRFYMK
jgi:hypothetical protein